MASLAGLAVAAGTLLSMGLTAGPASAAASSGCPTSAKGLPTDNQVSAAAVTPVGSNVTTYQFSSLKDEAPVNGVPGLMKYCVYPSPSSAKPTNITPDPVQAVGDNGAKWVTGTGSNNFAFVRPGGNPSDIGLKGQDVTMGTATWKAGAVPTGQAIVLHVNDPSVCASLYAGSTSPTCFVLPGPPRQVGPVCDKGDNGPTIAYNAMPFDVVNCLNPGESFEGDFDNEMGDLVNLSPAIGTHISLKVDFQDFACGDSGHWSGTTQESQNPPPSLCKTTPGETFTHPITANLYDPAGTGGLTTPIATVTQDQVIPFRPSANPLCPAGNGAVAGARWLNPDAIGGPACQNSIGTVLTFNFPNSISLPSTVVWTVAFNTTHAGYNPVGENTACFQAVKLDDQQPGCGYDSLNVGAHTLPATGSPAFAGTDVNEDLIAISTGSPAATLQLQPGWTGFRPLGEIIAH